MKNITIIILFTLFFSISGYAQNTYSLQPGVKNNQIVLELKNISETEQTRLPKPLLKRGFKHLKFSDNIEELIILNPKETKELIYNFDVDYNVGTTEADTLEILITDDKSINITKQFILQYTQPTEFRLEQNYPNPFNPTTRIRYQVYSIGQTTLKVYDILGNELATLVNEKKEPGYYEVEFNASSIASGVYVYRLQSGSFVKSKKMMVLK
jgi:hypothetical protein